MLFTNLRPSLLLVFFIFTIFYACEPGTDYVDELEYSSLPDCYTCSKLDEVTQICLSDLEDVVVNGGEVEFLGSRSVIDPFVGDDFTPELINDYASLLYGMVLTYAIDEGYSCLVDIPCECEDGKKKIKICHIPNGDCRKAKTKRVRCKALKAHLKHGDFCGDCNDMNLGLTEINIENIEDFMENIVCPILDLPEEDCDAAYFRGAPN